MKRFSTIHMGPGTQSGPSTVSHCLAVGHASLLCPHCELFFTRSSSPQHGPIFLSSCSYHTAQKMSLASDSAHHRSPPGASQHSFEKQMGRLIPGLFFDASYYLIAGWQYPGQRDFTVQPYRTSLNCFMVEGLSWSQQPHSLPGPVKLREVCF